MCTILCWCWLFYIGGLCWMLCVLSSQCKCFFVAVYMWFRSKLEVVKSYEMRDNPSEILEGPVKLNFIFCWVLTPLTIQHNNSSPLKHINFPFCTIFTDAPSWRDSPCCLAVLWITLIVCLLMAIVLFSVVYCKLTPTSWTCHYIRVQYRALAHHLDFLAYKMSSSKN